MLGLAGFGQIILAADGMDARTVLNRETIDLVLANWIMAPMDGATLLRWIRQAPESPNHGLPVILLTARADVPMVRAAWEAGADSVLAKPLTPATLIRRIKDVLRRPAKRATPPPSVPQRMPTASASSTGPSLIRLRSALDQLESMLKTGAINAAALRVIAAHLHHATSGDAAMEAVTRSFIRCAIKADPFTPAFLDTMHAHLVALRWLAARHENDANLAAWLDASVDSLIETHPIIEGFAWKALLGVRHDQP